MEIDILTGVLRAMRQVEMKYMFRPDKVILTPPHVHEIYKHYANHYLDVSPDNRLAKLFGIDLEIGEKSEVKILPEYQNYAIPGENGLEIEAQQIQVRSEVSEPIITWTFQGYIVTKKTRGDLVNHVSENELVAIETLREMISETEYRRYMKYGFISVRSKSGSVYQVFRNHPHTKVWKDGKLVEEVCVRIRNKVPPTDNVIAFKIMIETDEDEFKKIGNVYNMRKAA